jgi:hypothetical protein
VDTFDPKPALADQEGKPLPRPGSKDKPGIAFASPFAFGRHGQCGLEVSELFPHLARCADDLCVIRSMQTDEPNHEPALLLMNCGAARFARPSVGSWVTYGLGSDNQNLPGFVVLYPENQPTQGVQNWQSAFLPGVFQGTPIDTRHRRVEKLIEHIRSPHASEREQRLQLDLLAQVNRLHQRERPEDGRLESRIESFELAYRMQTEATDAFDISHEPRKVRDLYGNSAQGRQMLLARRLVERGVRFVQVWHGNWDSHDDLATAHRDLARDSDQAIAGLLVDLKQRGLLQDTLVICGGEFGRTPTRDPGSGAANKKPGRDHNASGFSLWLASGGVKAGHVHGATDEFGFEAVEGAVHVHDLQATLLHLLGFDHEKLTFRYAGRDFRLTDVKGSVVKGILA